MSKLKEIVLEGMVFPATEDSNEEGTVEHEIVINGKSYSAIKNDIPVYEYNRSEPTSSIKLNGEDPFRFGRPIILKGNVDKNFEAWNDKDILIFLGRNNAITLLQKNEVHKIAVKLDIV